MNSVSLQMCYSNAAYVKNTLENDAILRVGHPNQSIHITTALPGHCNALITMKNNDILIDGNLVISGILTSTNIVGSNSTIVGNGTTNNTYAHSSYPGGYFNDSLASSTIYAIEYNITDNIKSPTLSESVIVETIFIGDYVDMELDNNTLYTNNLFFGTYINYTYTDYGVLSVLHGGTGVKEKTGEGKVVLNSNPYFQGTIYANAYDSKNNPGYSWAGMETTGLYHIGTGIGISVASSNVASIDNEGINIVGDCSASSFTTTSDKRIKNNIQEIDNALSIVDKLEPQIYTKSYGGLSITESGLIAQDLYHNVPELHHLLRISPDANINQDEWGSIPARINYIGVIPYLIKSIQELKRDMCIKDARIKELLELFVQK